jgi:hypothetical protein
MAETKTRASNRRGKSTTRKPTKAKARRPSTAKTPTNGGGSSASARKAVEGAAKQAGHTVSDAGRSAGRAARSAKTPLLAGGAALAGVAGGIALGTRQARHSKTPLRRPKLKVDSHQIARAAKDVGEFGAGVGQLAAELRRNREQASNSSKRRSPIEVVLQGLTTRGGA